MGMRMGAAKLHQLIEEPRETISKTNVCHMCIIRHRDADEFRLLFL